MTDKKATSLLIIGVTIAKRASISRSARTWTALALAGVAMPSSRSHRRPANLPCPCTIGGERPDAA
jgi:hypothetical protein